MIRTSVLSLMVAIPLALTACAASPGSEDSSQPPPSGTTTVPTTSSPDIIYDGDEGPPGSLTPEPSYTPQAPPGSTSAPTHFPSPTLSAGKAGRARGERDPASINRSDPDAVAAAFAAALVAVDTDLDQRPNDAGARAARYATDSLADEMTESAPIANPGAVWTELVNRNGWTTVQTAEGGLGQGPPDTKSQAWRAITTTATPTNDSGWTGERTTTTWIIELHHRRGQWSVASYEALS